MKKLILFTILLLCTSTLFAYDVALEWDHSPSPGVVGYKMYVGQSSGAYDLPIFLPYTTTYTVTGLGEGQYCFSATALDDMGNESGYSNEVCTMVGPPPPPPDTTAPIINALDITPDNTQIALSWETDELATTEVEYGLSQAYGTVLSDTTLTTIHGVIIRNLERGQMYHLRIHSSDAAGNTASSQDISVRTKPVPPGQLRRRN